MYEEDEGESVEEDEVIRSWCAWSEVAGWFNGFP